MEVGFRSGGEIEENVTTTSGTTLKITGLRDDWTKERVNKVVSALQRLVNPFVDDGKIKINVKYHSSSTGIAELDVDVSNDIATILDRKPSTQNVLLKKEKLVFLYWIKRKLSTLLNLKIQLY